MTWQPIDTAPKDAPLLVLRRDGVMHVARVAGFERKYGILDADFGNASCHFFFPVGGVDADGDAPTHWWDFGDGRALPEPPEAPP